MEGTMEMAVMVAGGEEKMTGGGNDRDRGGGLDHSHLSERRERRRADRIRLG